jgi:hypothetical protein
MSIGEIMNVEQSDQYTKVLTALKNIDTETLKSGDRQWIGFSRSSWDIYLARAGRKDLAKTLSHLSGAVSQERISRRDIIDLAHKTATKRDREALLIAALVWGKGPKNNRMFPAFVRLLTDPQLDAALEGSAQHAAAGRPAAAYRSWRESGVRGLGEAFFTKWLWAASHTGPNRFSPEKPRCLVLDARVWNSLGADAHRWSSVVAAGTNRRADRYEAYTRACAHWANELGVSAENVEWALFHANGTIDKKSFAAQ